MATEDTELSWPELSADLTLARSQARSTVIDNQRSTSPERINELTSQLELMRTRMISLEQHLADSQQDIPGDLRSRLDDIEASLSRTGERFQELGQSIDDVRSEDASASSQEVADLASMVEQSFAQLNDLTNTIDAEREARASEHETLTAEQRALEDHQRAIRNDQRTLGDGQDSLLEQLAATESRLTDLERTTRETDAERDTAISKWHETAEYVELTDARIAELEQAATRVADLAQLMEAERSTNANNHRLTREHLDVTDCQIIDLESSVSDLQGRVQDLHGRVDTERESRAAADQGSEEFRATIDDKFASVDQSVDELQGSIEQTSRSLNGRVDATAADLNERVDATAADLNERVDATAADLTGRIDQASDRLTNRIDETASHLGERIDETHAELSARADQAAQEAELTARSEIESLTGSIAEQASRIDEHAATTDHISQTVEYLEKRAQATDDNHKARNGELVELVEQAQRRLDEGLSEITEVHSGIGPGDRAAAEKDLDALKAKVYEHRADQETANRKATQATHSLESRVALHRQTIDAHSAILDATTQLIANQNDVAASSTAAIADAQKIAGEALSQARQVEDSKAGMSEDIEALTDLAGAHHAHIEELAESTARLETSDAQTRKEISALAGQVDQTAQQGSQTQEALTILEGHVSEQMTVLEGRVGEQGRHGDQTTEEIGTLASRIDELAQRGQSDQTREEIDALSGRITEQAQKGEQINVELSALGERTNQHDTHIDDLSKRVEETETAAQQAIIDAKKTAPHTHGTIEKRLAHLEPTVESHTSTIESIADLSTSLEERTTLLEDRAKIVKAQLFDLVSRADAAPDLNEHLEEIADVVPTVEDHARQIEALNDWVTIVDGRAVDAETQQHATQEHIDAINDWVTSIDARMSSVETIETPDNSATEERVDDLDERTIALENQAQTMLEQLATVDEQAITTLQQFDATNEQFSAIDEQVSAIDERLSALDATVTEASEDTSVTNELSSRVESLDEVTTSLDSKIASLNETTAELDARIISLDTAQRLLPSHDGDSENDRFDEQIASLDERTEELEALSQSARGDIESATQLLTELDEKVAELSEATPQTTFVAGTIATDPTEDGGAVNEMVEATQARMDFFQRQINFNQEQIDESDERIKGLDIRTTALINESVKDLDERTSLLEELTGGTDGTNAASRLDMADQKFEAANDWMVALDARVMGLVQQAESTTEYIESANLQHRILDERVLEVQKRGYSTQEQIDEANETASKLEVRTALLEARLAETRTESTEANTVTQRSIEETQESVAETRSSLSETQASVDALAAKLEDTRSAESDELRDFMVYRIDAAEDRIDRRLADVEAGGVSTDRLETIERTVADADRRATEAYEFSENLRLLQTDLVQALQSEIETCADDLRGAMQRIAELEGRISSTH